MRLVVVVRLVVRLVVGLRVVVVVVVVVVVGFSPFLLFTRINGLKAAVVVVSAVGLARSALSNGRTVVVGSSSPDLQSTLVA